MLTIRGQRVRLCDGLRRRDFLTIGSLAMGGLTLPQLLEAEQRFGALQAAAVHRAGPLDIGDVAVAVAVSSAHRDEAFRACRYIIDQAKARLPIWKKEFFADGTAEWVNCKRCGHHATAGRGD